MKLSECEIGKRIRVRSGTRDPDVPTKHLPPLIGKIIDSEDGYIRIQIENANSFPEYITFCAKLGFALDEISLHYSRFEPL